MLSQRNECGHSKQTASCQRFLLSSFSLAFPKRDRLTHNYTDANDGGFIERLGKSARLQGVRCSPHTFRHYAAISFLRAGGNSFTLQNLLGHSSLTMTMNYVKIAEADITAQHRQFSPVAR
ncbi:MAG: site-specific integrase, partial [Akkermansiaceae bacterium]|nr:site-specific integrase [Armatimonadota bacterium]